MQSTLKSAVSFHGVGLHSGATVDMIVRPAAVDHGIRLKRTDMRFGGVTISARLWAVQSSDLCTRLGNGAGAHIDTVEHVLAALSACGIDNAQIDLNGPECPILDGSAKPIVRAFMGAGGERQGKGRTVIRVLRSVRFEQGEAWARLVPAPRSQMQFRIAFDDAAIGEQALEMSLAGQNVIRQLCDSRTFCQRRDIAAMRARGLVRGGSLENSLVTDGARVMSPGGLRHADEPVRHKMLDAIGDLALAGAPILGRYCGHHAGHAVTIGLLRALFSQPDAFERVPCTPSMARNLPGRSDQGMNFFKVA